MSTSYEIKKLAKKISNARQDINAEKKILRSEMNQLTSWWRGSAATAYLNKCGEADYDIDSICRSLDDLQNKMIALANALERAEQERRAAAAKARE